MRPDPIHLDFTRAPLSPDAKDFAQWFDTRFAAKLATADYRELDRMLAEITREYLERLPTERTYPHYRTLHDVFVEKAKIIAKRQEKLVREHLVNPPPTPFPWHNQPFPR
jgi:hypothetical protein